MGISGGGPHAVVCARFLSERVGAAAILSGVAAVDQRGSEAGMMAANRVFTRLARHAPGVNRLPFGIVARLGRRSPERALAIATKRLPAPDAAVLRRPEVRDAFLADLGHASATTGRAAAQDFALFARDWGFRLEDITAPVHVWQAEADVNVPAEHARRLAAAIPGAVLHLLPDEGHLMAIDHMARSCASSG